MSWISSSIMARRGKAKGKAGKLHSLTEKEVAREN